MGEIAFPNPRQFGLQREFTNEERYALKQLIDSAERPQAVQSWVNDRRLSALNRTNLQNFANGLGNQ